MIIMLLKSLASKKRSNKKKEILMVKGVKTFERIKKPKKENRIIRLYRTIILCTLFSIQRREERIYLNNVDISLFYEKEKSIRYSWDIDYRDYYFKFYS